MLRIFSGGGAGGLFEEGNKKEAQFHNAMYLTRHDVLLTSIQKQINLKLNYLVHLNKH